MSKGLTPADLKPKDARAALAEIVEVLYPRGNPDAEWLAETIEGIAQVLDRYAALLYGAEDVPTQ